MANKKNWLGILALVLLFGITVIGCDNNGSNGDNNHKEKLNPFKGTWVGLDGGGQKITIVITDTTYQGVSIDYRAKGTYTYNGSTGQFTQTHMDFGSGWTTDGSPFGITLPMIVDVTVSGNTLILTALGTETIYTKVYGNNPNNNTIPEILPSDWKTLDYAEWENWFEDLDMETITEETQEIVTAFLEEHLYEMTEGGQQFWIEMMSGGDIPVYPTKTHEFIFDGNETLTVDIYGRGVDEEYKWEATGRGEFPVGLWIHNPGEDQETLSFTADKLTQYSPWFGTLEWNWEISGNNLILNDGVYIPSQEELDEIANFDETLFRSERPWIPATSTIDPQVGWGWGGIDYNIVDHPDMTFVNDPLVIGVWSSVYYIDEIDDFLPGSLYLWELFWTGVEFVSGGTIKTQIGDEIWRNNGKWTNGLIQGIPTNMAASEYELKTISGTTYLFIQWKSGDYSARGDKPQYYVLAKD